MNNIDSTASEQMPPALTVETTLNDGPFIDEAPQMANLVSIDSGRGRHAEARRFSPRARQGIAVAALVLVCNLEYRLLTGGDNLFTNAYGDAKNISKTVGDAGRKVMKVVEFLS